jgi:hypothetical protein
LYGSDRENIESEYCLELKTPCSSFLFLFGSKIFQEVGSRDECYKDVLNVDRPLDSDVTGTREFDGKEISFRIRILKCRRGTSTPTRVGRKYLPKKNYGKVVGAKCV